MFIVVLIACIALALRLGRGRRNYPRFPRRKTAPAFDEPPKAGMRFRRKPQWVVNKVIRLKALCPQESLRGIANQFNRLEACTTGETVSHGYVNYTLKTHRLEVARLMAKIRKQRPRPVPQHLIWAGDITFLPDAQGASVPVFGLLEHASRACLSLTALRAKTSAALLRSLADAIERFEVRPKILRTDNEAVFTSRAFRFGLWLAGIRHQRTEICSPWQNGKIERFFGTFKRKARGLVFDTLDELNDQLAVFRFWYQHIRPHQYLDYRTPFEAYHRLPIQYAKPDNDPLFFEAWQGRLTGVLPPGTPAYRPSLDITGFWFRRE